MSVKKSTLLALLGLISLCYPSIIQAQDTLFFEDFQNPGSTGFTLNTADLSSASGTSGVNQWIINNAYTGGSGSLVCLGFPFTYTINNTAAQPGGISGGPNRYYLHTISDYGIADNIFCSSFAAPDGFCIFPENNFVKMTNDVSTVGYQNVSAQFWWTCGGGTAIHGELYYSTNSGTSWTQITSPIAQYKNQLTWTQQTLTNSAFDNQTTLRFGVRFFAATSSSAIDPGMSIDDFVITGVIPQLVHTDSVSGSVFCPGDSLTVFGNISPNPANAGNIFYIQLSDSGGSFANPDTIGQLTDTTFTAIGGAIPASAIAGNGYRIRIVSSNPALTGNDNGTDITILPGSVAGTVSANATTVCAGDTTSLFLTGYDGIISWELTTNGGSSWLPISSTNPVLPSGAITSNTGYRAIVTNFPCPADTSATLTIQVEQPPVAGTIQASPDSICPGDSAVVSSIGAAGSGLDWQMSSDGITYTSTGQSGITYNTGPLLQTMYYQLAVSGNVCPDAISQPVSVTVVPFPAAAFTFTQNGDTAFFADASSGATTWNWTFGDGNSDNVQNPTHVYPGPGNYQVLLIVDNGLGCTDSLTDSITVLVGLMEIRDDRSLVIFPNPAEDFVQLRWEGGSPVQAVRLVDLNGKRLMDLKNDAPGNEFRMDLPELPEGLYLLQILRAGEWQEHKLIIRE